MTFTYSQMKFLFEWANVGVQDCQVLKEPQRQEYLRQLQTMETRWKRRLPKRVGRPDSAVQGNIQDSPER